MFKSIPFEIEDDDTIQTLFSRTGALALENHEDLTTVIGEKEGDIDFEKGTIDFGDNLVFNFQILGTLSAESKKWQYAWDNKDVGFNEDILIDAEKIKSFGEELNIPQLKESIFQASLHEAHLIAMTCSVLLKSDAYYVADFDEIYLFLNLYSDKIKHENSAERFLFNYDTFQKEFNEINSRLALEGYAILKGYEYKETEEFSVVKIEDSRIIVGFTERGNVSHIQTFIE
ncbi:DUF6882 domain-containing protein [Methanobrevibacter curvatus]|uniref:Uncharacterized protein n=1 Tax=Methanobrevibacter curvatus TaxID=49547 RepID=A0A162FGK7_9EURY|nr:DUF6882 domain-containing protein [Methanobrevibacter curvatus]KZX12745.1 hypothetical protein MBCUR_09420 [Methanobrevibacter curvatus]